MRKTDPKRCFTYDAFLSHNAGDESLALRDALTARGAVVWHDEAQDMADRAISARVSLGLAAARYVCVCVGARFRDSEWVNAEYETALAFERALRKERDFHHRVFKDDKRAPTEGLARIIVATWANHAAIPEKLRMHHTFDVSSAAEIDRMAAFLVRENASANDTAREIERWGYLSYPSPELSLQEHVLLDRQTLMRWMNDLDGASRWTSNALTEIEKDIRKDGRCARLDRASAEKVLELIELWCSSPFFSNRIATLLEQRFWADPLALIARFSTLRQRAETVFSKCVNAHAQNIEGLRRRGGPDAKRPSGAKLRRSYEAFWNAMLSGKSFAEAHMAQLKREMAWF